MSRAIPFLVLNQKKNDAEVFRSILFASSLVGAVDIGLWVACSNLIHTYLFQEVPVGAVMRAGVIAFAQCLILTIQSYLRTLSRFRTASVLQLTTEIGILLSLLIFVQLGVDSIIDSVLVGNLTTLAFGITSLLLLGKRVSPMISYALVSDSIRYGLKAQVGTMVHFLNYRLDHIILGVISGPSIVGVYSVASKCAELFRALPNAVGFVIEPKLARETRETAYQHASGNYLYIFLVNGIIVVIASSLVPYLLPFLIGEWTNLAIRPFLILMVGLAMAGGNCVITSFNMAQGFPFYNSIGAIVAAGVTLLLDFALIPWFGVTGAALASLASRRAGAAT